MNIVFQEYQEKFSSQLASLLDAFQGYLAHNDPLKRIKFSTGYGERALKHMLTEVGDHSGVFYLAMDNETVVGFAAGIIEELPEFDQLGVVATKSGRLIGLYIDASYRGQGIGTALVRRVEEYFKTQGCGVMKTSAFAHNAPVRNLYQKIGFEEREIELIKSLSK